MTLTVNIITKNIIVSNYIIWIIKAIIILIVFNGTYILIYKNNSDFKYIVKKMLKHEK